MKIEEAIQKFNDYMVNEKNYSIHTCKGYHTDLQQLIQYLLYIQGTNEDDTNAELTFELEAINKLILRGFITWVQKSGVSKRSVARKIASINCFFKFCQRKGYLEETPNSSLIYPKLGNHLPEKLTAEDIEALLSCENEDDFLGLRNSLIIELLYTTGVRVSELVGINHADLNLADGQVLIRGKRKKERLVLIGHHAADKLSRYLTEKKHYLAKEVKPGTHITQLKNEPLIINRLGKRLTQRSVERIVAQATLKAKLHRHITPHTLRHTFATHLLENGADIRGISELLGHKNLRSTQIYTKLDIFSLMKIYDKAHPRAKK